MTQTLAFDVYGTLIDTNGVVVALQNMVGEQASEFSRMWREKQLEYTFRRGLMHRYRDFSVCTREAMEYTCQCLQIQLSTADRQSLIDAYGILPVFDDVQTALLQLRKADHQLYAFSNGQAHAVTALLEQAGILEYFLDVISVDEIQTFKPDPAVYQHMLQRCGSHENSTWLISGNPFDVMGAVSAGLRGAWLQRTDNTVFDPWEDMVADTTISSLLELDVAIAHALME